MIGRPEASEAKPYYFTYIDRVESSDIIDVLKTQSEETLAPLGSISEDKSLYRYAPDKWSIREVLNHVSDSERIFLSRALWFARGFVTPLPEYDQNICVPAARADEVSWSSHLDEFRAVRLATIAFFRNLPEDAWMRRGVASGNPFSVRALAYIIAGHVTHHMGILQERYS
jgi:uncharacterized damage-inducible protein DinB